MGDSVPDARRNRRKFLKLLRCVTNLEHLKTVQLHVAPISQNRVSADDISRPWSRNHDKLFEWTEENQEITRVMDQLLHEVERLLLQVSSLEKVKLEVYEWQPEKQNVASEHVSVVFPELQREGIVD